MNRRCPTLHSLNATQLQVTERSNNTSIPITLMYKWPLFHPLPIYSQLNFDIIVQLQSQLKILFSPKQKINVHEEPDTK